MRLLYIVFLALLISGVVLAVAQDKPVKTTPPGVYKQPRYEVELRIARRDIRELKNEIAALKDRVAKLEAAEIKKTL